MHNFGLYIFSRRFNSIIFIIMNSFLLLFCQDTKSQNLQSEGLFDFNSIFQQKNIRISERIRKEWNMQNYFIQQTYYNANKDTEVDSFRQVTRVLSIHNMLNGTRKIIELLDDGNHFDKNAADGIFSNTLIGHFDEFNTKESIIDIQFDSTGINYSIQYDSVSYIPETPVIIFPGHNSIISEVQPEVFWEVDIKVNRCGIILLGGTPNYDKKFKNIVWEKKYNVDYNTKFSEKIPVGLLNNNSYTLVVWTSTDSKSANDLHIGERGAYSIDWSQFYVNTLSENKDIILLQNYPNPFNSRTIIVYKIPSNGIVTIKIYDTCGKEITNLINKEQASGEYYIGWDGENDAGVQASSGIYFCRMLFNNHSLAKKIILQR